MLHCIWLEQRTVESSNSYCMKNGYSKFILGNRDGTKVTGNSRESTIPEIFTRIPGNLKDFFILVYFLDCDSYFASVRGAKYCDQCRCMSWFLPFWCIWHYELFMHWTLILSIYFMLLCFTYGTIYIIIIIIVISVFVCLSVCFLSVCLLAYFRNHTSKFHQIFCACYPWLWLGPPQTAMWYVICFRFCGWCVFTHCKE